MENKDEQIIIKRILEGETAIFSHFVEQYSHSVYSMIVRIVQSREDAEELSQDAFLKAFSKLETFKGDCSFSTWLFRIAYNTAISFVRKKKVILPAIDERIIETVSDEAVGTFFDEDENERRLQQLEIAIAQLNAEEKALITLFYLESKPVNELAVVFGLTTENVRVKLHRTRKKLFVLIKMQDGER